MIANRGGDELGFMAIDEIIFLDGENKCDIIPKEAEPKITTTKATTTTTPKKTTPTTTPVPSTEPPDGRLFKYIFNIIHYTVSRICFIF